MSMGEAAADNCDDFGWEPVGRVDPSLVAETSQSRRYGHGRAWSRSSEYRLRGDGESLYLVLTVEGGFEFTVDDDTVATCSGEVVFLDGHAPTFARTTIDTARYVWFIRPTILNLRRSRFALHEPLNVSNAPMQSLIAMTNTMLNAGARLSSRAQGQVGLAAEHLVAAALDETGRVTDVRAMHRDGVITTAQIVLDDSFRDPHFGVAELARALSMSASRVHAIFAAFGTTPRRELERRRLIDVERSRQSTPSLTEVVQNAGFLSVRTYHATLARQRRSVEDPTA